MAAKAKKAQWLPKKADAFALCKQLNGGSCSCEANSTGPCSALRLTLIHCHANGLDPVEYEKSRMKGVL